MHGEENTIDTMWLDGFPWPVVGAMTRGCFCQHIWFVNPSFMAPVSHLIAMIARLIASKAISPSTGVMDVPRHHFGCCSPAVAFGDGFKERFGYEYLDVQIEFRQFRVHLPCCPSHPFYQFQLHHSMIR